MISLPTVRVIGGGLAGCEVAWQALNRGARVILYEMRPHKKSAAHKSNHLAELVCSNSLKSMDMFSAPGLLKNEMKDLNSLIISSAYKARVPAGSALAVDRDIFSSTIEASLGKHENFTCIRQEVTKIPSFDELVDRNEVWVVASGPLTSCGLMESVKCLCGNGENLYFYDAIAPVISADSIDWKDCFKANRYGKGNNEGDYINIPLNKCQYLEFVSDIIESEKMPLHAFETAKYFESCLPVEVMAERGIDTLRFGPLKPVGLVDPKTGSRPYACIQLRKENKSGTMYSMVGFQSKMKWPEQKRVFSKLPALANVEIFRYGSIHRNTYIQSPSVLGKKLDFRSNRRVFLAGQLTGVEGYCESAAIGLLVGTFVAEKLGFTRALYPPPTTMMGSLLAYVTTGCQGPYAPMNANFGLLPPVAKVKGISRAERKKTQAAAAQTAFEAFHHQQVDSLACGPLQA